MKRIAIYLTASAAALVPAAVGLWGNASFAHGVSHAVGRPTTAASPTGADAGARHVAKEGSRRVTVASRPAVGGADDRGKHVEPGDDKGHHAEPGHHKRHHVEPGDDKSGVTAGADDHGHHRGHDHGHHGGSDDKGSRGHGSDG